MCEREADLTEYPLHLACDSGSICDVRRLIAQGMDANDRDDLKKTPLHVAANREIALLLTENGADIFARDLQGNTVLHTSAARGRMGVAEYLIRKGLDVNDNKCAEGYTPLHVASGYGHYRLVEMLMNKGASVDAKDEEKAIPLHSAVGIWPRIEKSSWEYSFVDNAPPEQSSLYWWASTCGRLDVVMNWLKQEQKPVCSTLERRLYRLFESGKIQVVKLLVKTGSKLNAKSLDGNTPLHIAVKLFGCENAKVLLEAGASVDLMNGEGKTPLQIADSNELRSILINHNADVFVRDDSDRTLLHRAAEEADLEFARMLVEKGVDVDVKDERGLTPLHYASRGRRKSHMQTAKFLISAGASIGAMDINNKTPLHYAETQEMAETLLAGGANLYAMDLYGRAPLYSVSSNLRGRRHLQKLLEFLLLEGSNVNARDFSGRTPLHLSKNSTLAGILLKYGADPDIKDHLGKTPCWKRKKRCLKGFRNRDS
ncbi:MAG: ankyrin repeat domain-containing protein [bacterium]